MCLNTQMNIYNDSSGIIINAQQTFLQNGYFQSKCNRSHICRTYVSTEVKESNHSIVIVEPIDP